MRSSFFLLVFTLIGGSCLAQNNSLEFEAFGLSIDTFINQSLAGEGFERDGFFFPNSYTETDAFSSWSGWSISSMRDTTTPGFSNEYSCIAGSGRLSSSYGVSFGVENYILVDKDSVESLSGIYVNNSTYAYLSMRDGDAFAKRFGGVDGTDKDFFKLIIHGSEKGNPIMDSIVVYLADYRFDNPEDDYILNEWTYVDLTPLSLADSLSFSLCSSDIGQFGMNTPAYFCIDNIEYIARNTSVSLITETSEGTSYSFFPNPCQNLLNIDGPKPNAQFTIYSMCTGKPCLTGYCSYDNSIDLSSLPSGAYILCIDNSYTTKLLKH